VKALCLATLLALCLVAAACGGTNRASHPGATSATTRARTVTNADTAQTLAAAARAALRANHRLSRFVLWHNSVPDWAASSTQGPALAALRKAAAARRQRGIHVKVVTDRFGIKSLHLDPSYTRVTAVIVNPQRVQPYGADGHPLGRSVRLTERSRFVLRRLGTSQRFVVWQVMAAK
jgi:hypothetical protein